MRQFLEFLPIKYVVNAEHSECTHIFLQSIYIGFFLLYFVLFKFIAIFIFIFPHLQIVFNSCVYFSSCALWWVFLLLLLFVLWTDIATLIFMNGTFFVCLSDCLCVYVFGESHLVSNCHCDCLCVCEIYKENLGSVTWIIYYEWMWTVAMTMTMMIIELLLSGYLSWKYTTQQWYSLCCNCCVIHTFSKEHYDLTYIRSISLHHNTTNLFYMSIHKMCVITNTIYLQPFNSHEISIKNNDFSPDDYISRIFPQNIFPFSYTIHH